MGKDTKMERDIQILVTKRDGVNWGCSVHDCILKIVKYVVVKYALWSTYLGKNNMEGFMFNVINVIFFRKQSEMVHNS